MSLTDSEPDYVTLSVSFHPSGRWTLSEKLPDQIVPTDLKGPLFANSNKGDFYRAVDKEIEKRRESGQDVHFVDV